MGLTLLTPPTAEPLTRAELKLWLKVEVSADDALIDALGQAARQLVEQVTDRALITQTWRLTLPRLGPRPVRLPVWPVQSVTSVAYTDSTGVAASWDASLWALSAAEPPELVPAYQELWPIQWAGGVTLGPRADAASVTFVAGYGADGSAVPGPVLTAIKLLVQHWYVNRQAVVTGTIATELPWAVDALLGPYCTGRYR
jgi:uncharacterized phiE125 gp8 family phage protein